MKIWSSWKSLRKEKNKWQLCQNWTLMKYKCWIRRVSYINSIFLIFLFYFRSFRQFRIIFSMGCQNSSLQAMANQESQSFGRKNRIKKQGKVNQRIAIQELNLQNVTKLEIQLTKHDIELAENLITNHYLFYRLSSVQRKNFLQNLELCEAKPNEYIFKKGETATMFFIIRKGSVGIELNNLEKDVKVLGPGQSFGELALIYTAPRSASVKALQHCEFLCISHHVFKKAMQQIVKKNYQLAKSYIDKITLFKYLTSKEKTNLAYHTHSLKFNKGDVVFKEGDDANSFFIIISGSVKLDIPHKNPITMKDGQSFGQNSFKKDQVRSGTAICEDKVHILAISRESISKCLGGQFRQLIFYNIMKWSLKRIPLFKNCSNLVLEKIIGKCQIKKFKNSDVIAEKGQIVSALILCLQGNINGKQPGSIFHGEFLQKDHKQSSKIPQSLIKEGDGFVCFLQFSLLEKLFGGSLLEIVQKSSIKDDIIELETLKKHELSNLKLSNFKIIKKLGEGQFGLVFHVEDEANNKYALKCIQKSKIVENQMESFIQQQRQIFENLDSPFIVSCYRTFKDSHFIYFLLKMIEGKDFFDILRQIGLLNQQIAAFYIGCLILAVEYLHSKNIVYRDLKPENAVVDKKGYLIMIDLGTAKFLNEENGFRTFTIIGTPHYMAPEVIEGKGYSFPVDIWALGIILYEMVCGKLPYGQNLNDPVDIYKQIVKTKLKFPKYYKDEAGKQLMKKLLIKESELRSIEEFAKLKNDQYFQDFDWQKLTKKKLLPPFLSNSKDMRDDSKINQKVTDYMNELKKGLKTKKFDSKVNDWDEKF